MLYMARLFSIIIAKESSHIKHIIIFTMPLTIEWKKCSHDRIVGMVVHKFGRDDIVCLHRVRKKNLLDVDHTKHHCYASNETNASIIGRGWTRTLLFPHATDPYDSDGCLKEQYKILVAESVATEIEENYRCRKILSVEIVLLFMGGLLKRPFLPPTAE
jgi:hypothetical protein